MFSPPTLLPPCRVRRVLIRSATLAPSSLAPQPEDGASFLWAPHLERTNLWRELTKPPQVKMLANGSATMAEIAEVAGVTRQAVRPHPSQAAKS